jgi:hypothetical protein
VRSFGTLALAAALAVGGCAGTGATGGASLPTDSPPAFSDATAGQAMVAARAGYGAAIAAALAYGNLPPCSETQKAPCRDAARLAQLQKADRTAFAALDAADAMLRGPSLGATARDRAIQTAQAALLALTALTGGLK